MKKCIKCGVKKEINADNFYRRKNSKDGFMNVCKLCESAQRKIYKRRFREKNKERIREESREYYIRNRERILERDRLKRLKLKEKREIEKDEREEKRRLSKLQSDIERDSSKVKEELSKNPDYYYHKYIRDYIRLYERGEIGYNDKEEYLKLLEEDKKIKSIIAKKHYEKNKELRKKQIKQYLKDNPDKKRKWTRQTKQRRKAKIRGLPHTLTTDEWEQAKMYFNNSCAYCGNSGELHREHFIPLSKGGGYTRDNIIPSCPECNSDKSDTDFFEWYPKFARYSKEREEKILKYLKFDKEKRRQLTLL